MRADIMKTLAINCEYQDGQLSDKTMLQEIKSAKTELHTSDDP